MAQPPPEGAITFKSFQLCITIANRAASLTSDEWRKSGFPAWEAPPYLKYAPIAPGVSALSLLPGIAIFEPAYDLYELQPKAPHQAVLKLRAELVARPGDSWLENPVHVWSSRSSLWESPYWAWVLARLLSAG